MIAQNLNPVLEELQLSAVAQPLPQTVRDAAERNPSYEEFLYRLLEEVAARRRAGTEPQAFTTLPQPAPRLQVGTEARWFEVAGRPTVNLSRRGPIRRILLALLEAHPEGRALDVSDMVSAGWPNEVVSAEVGATRVYTAVRTLRRLGLEGVLVTQDSGYLLAPRAVVLRVEN